MAGSGPSTIFGGGGADVADEADGAGDELVPPAPLPDLSSPHPASVTSPAGTVARRRERRRTMGASIGRS
jgi:hypothetical protein